jgi:hypothetical protein
MGDGFGVVRRNATEKSLAFDKIAVFVGNPITDGVGTCKPTVLPGESFRSDAMLICTIWACTMTKEGEDDLRVAICGGKVKGCGA